MYENRVPKRIFGSEQEEVAGSCKTLHNEELHSSPNIRVITSRMIRSTGHAACKGEMRTGYKILVGKSKGKRLLGRSGRRWEDNIGR
jgi:hypothetical protein